jgi:hypothetical protein
VGKVVASLRVSIFVAAIAALAAGCDESKKSAGQTAARTVATSSQAAPLAFDGEQGEYYVIAYMHCQKEVEALAKEYGMEPVAKHVAKAHAVLYGDHESPGAYQGCLDALEGSPNKVWVGK